MLLANEADFVVHSLKVLNCNCNDFDIDIVLSQPRPHFPHRTV